MSEQAFLKDLEKILRSEDVDSAIFEASEEAPYNRLLIFLGSDYQNREKTLELIVQQQELAEQLFEKPAKKQKNGIFFRCQFQLTFPFEIQEFALQQTASLLLFLNRHLELPGLEMSEIDNRLFYRYVLLTGEASPNRKLFLAIIGIIMMISELYTETIERIASGKTTFNELLEEVLKIANRIKENQST